MRYHPDWSPARHLEHTCHYARWPSGAAFLFQQPLQELRWSDEQIHQRGTAKESSSRVTSNVTCVDFNPRSHRRVFLRYALLRLLNQSSVDVEPKSTASSPGGFNQDLAFTATNVHKSVARTHWAQVKKLINYRLGGAHRGAQNVAHLLPLQQFAKLDRFGSLSGFHSTKK